MKSASGGVLGYVLAGALAGAGTLAFEMTLRLPWLYLRTLERGPVGYPDVWIGYAASGALGGVVAWMAWEALRAVRAAGPAIRGAAALVGLGVVAVGVAAFARLVGSTELDTGAVLTHVAMAGAGVATWVVLLALLRTLATRRGVLRVTATACVLIGASVLLHVFILRAMTLDRLLDTLPAASAGEEAPNVLLLSIDTQRADRLGAYGHDEDLSPRIDSIASEGALFENVFAQSSWTRTSFGSLMTSRYPSQHGAFVVNDPALEGFHDTWSDMLYNEGLRDEAVTMAEIFREHGYVTVALQANWQASEAQNFDQGFDAFVYEPLFTVPLWDRCLLGTYGSWLPALVGRERRLPFYTTPPDAREVYEVYRALLEGGLPQPFFLWINFMDPHSPYDAREAGASPADARVVASWDSWDLDTPARVLRDAYDDEIRFVDHWVGEVVERLREIGALDETVLVLTSDHGEDFEDHLVEVRFADKVAAGRHHGHSLYNELLRVPLIVRYPPAVPRGARVPSQVRLIDVLPTVLELTGIDGGPYDGVFEGESLVTLLDGGDEARDCFSERNYFGLEWKAVQDERFKLILRFAEDTVELYDLEQDASERNDLAAERPEDVARLRAKLDSWMERMGPILPEGAGSSSRTLDPRTLERLKALGYVQ